MRQKVLSSAYLRALKDPFPPARQAAILAMAATHNFFTLRESASRLLPALCNMSMDPEKIVRDQVIYLTSLCLENSLFNLSIMMLITINTALRNLVQIFTIYCFFCPLFVCKYITAFSQATQSDCS